MRAQVIVLPYDPVSDTFSAEALEEILRRDPMARTTAGFFVGPGGPRFAVLVERPACVGSKQTSPQVTEVPPLDHALRTRLDRLKAWRLKTARAEGVPAYIVMNDRQARAVVEAGPLSLEELGRVRGIGPARVARHGRAILEVLHGPATGTGPAVAGAEPRAEPVAPGADRTVPEEAAAEPDDPAGGGGAGPGSGGGADPGSA